MESSSPFNQPTWPVPSHKSPEKKTGVVFEPEYFNVQLQFAKAIAEKTGKELPDVLIEYTDFFRRFGLGQKLKPEDPRWQEYLKGIKENKDIVALSHDFYMNPPERVNESIKKETFGNLQYSYADGVVHMYLINNGNDSTTNIDSLKKDAVAMFSAIKAGHPEAKVVQSKSWLFSTALLQKLLPKSFLDSAKAETEHFQSAGRWGQFVDQTGKVKRKLRDQFFSNLKDLDISNLSKAFPVQTYEAEGDIQDFYKSCGISDKKE